MGPRRHVVFARPAAVSWTAVVLAHVPMTGETGILLHGYPPRFSATYLFGSWAVFCPEGWFVLLAYSSLNPCGWYAPQTSPPDCPSTLPVVLSIWFTSARTGEGQTGPCPPAGGTKCTCRGRRGVYLVTSEPLWGHLWLELSQRPSTLSR